MPPAREPVSVPLPPSRREPALDHVSERLAEEFGGIFSAETVEQLVRDSYDRLATTATVRTFLVLLGERFARERLHATARARGLVLSATPEVLFVCVHNAGRSQMAAALLDRYARGAVHVRSAGSHPSGHLDAAVVAAMREVGIDMADEYPKPLTDEVVRAADVVVTMGCGDACPVHPGRRYLDWDLEDPVGKSVEAIRPIREEIDRRVRALADELTARPTAPA